jgi:ATP phosphoribosyltransferase
MSSSALTLALPKGRILEQVQEHCASKGIEFSFKDRTLVTHTADGDIRIILVKNNDLPVYVNHGIAGLGICGSDVVKESGFPFYELCRFGFGSTRMCMAARQDHDPAGDAAHLTIATKFTEFTREYFHRRGIPVQIIKLNGSVELAPVLGLSRYIVDLVETGSTLKANNLKITDILAEIHVVLICNPAYYKLHYTRVDAFVSRIKDNDP